MKFLQNESHSYSISDSLPPLIDIVFLLIIFFLVSSTFEESEKILAINLPGTKGKGVASVKSREWKFVVDAQGTIYLDAKQLDKENVELVLKKNRARKKKINIVLKADKKVAYGVIAQLLGLFKEYGYTKIAFQTVESVK